MTREAIAAPQVQCCGVADSDHDLTVVIPAFNEESRLPKTLTDLTMYLDQWGINYRVIVVDDGSRDNTANLTEAIGWRCTTIKQPNGGKGSAVRKGILAATGRIVAFTDADLPYDLDALKYAFERIDSRQTDVVVGSRDLPGSTNLVERKLLRTVASFIFRSIVTVMVSWEVRDTQCGLKVFSRHASQTIFSRGKINGFAFDAEVVYLAHRLKMRIAKVPVVLVNEYATTISLTRNAIPMLIDVAKVRWRAFRGDYNLRLAYSAPAIISPAEGTPVNSPVGADYELGDGTAIS